MTDGFVIGKGYVGKATMKSLGITDYFTRSDANITLKEGAKKLFCFICLPTPTDENGGQDAARLVISDYIKQLKEYGGRNIFVIRSTVKPGTCKALAEEHGVMVVSNPEMLSEKTWEEDAIKPKIIILGADTKPAMLAMKNIYKDIKCDLKVFTDTVTAETIKYAFNTFFVTKVVFANQLYDICQKSGANYDDITYALHNHPWGSKNHFRVNDKGGRGAAGHCLPKDLQLFADYANSELLKTVQKLNREYLTASNKQV